MREEEQRRGTESCSGLQMITDLMGYVINCSYGWKRRGRDKSKIQQSNYAGKYSATLPVLVQSLESKCSPKITSEPQKRVVSCLK